MYMLHVLQVNSSITTGMKKLSKELKQHAISFVFLLPTLGFIWDHLCLANKY